MKYLIPMLVVFCLPLFALDNPWLSSPAPFDSSKVLSSFYEDLNGGVYGNKQRGFEFSKNAVSVYVRYRDALPDSLREQERRLFKEHEDSEGIYYEFTIGTLTYPTSITIDSKQVPKTVIFPKETSYQTMTPERCVSYIRDKNVFIFTGAGISYGGGVHIMSSLWASLGMDFSRQVDDFVLCALNSPEVLISKIWDFYRAARDNPPTKAHNILTSIALDKQMQIVTSNFDRLHHRTGILPMRTQTESIYKAINEETLSRVDAIITIGLSKDTRDILGAFREYNPDGVIIAIDLIKPSFIGPQDYFIEGDLQKTLQEIKQLYFR